MLFRTIPFTLALAIIAIPGYAQINDAMPAAATAATTIPNLIRYSGTTPRSDGKADAIEVSMTFLIYKDRQGGEPLWAETQSVAVDRSGHYDVHLGATNSTGLPGDLFSSGEARWLEVQAAGGKPEVRSLLVSVPYAMKAADAATLGGLPASAFQLAGTKTGDAQAAAITPDASAAGVTTPGGTIGYLPVYNGVTSVDDSVLFQSATKLGVNTITPAATLDVNGSVDARGALTLESNGAATTAIGKNSEPLQFIASAYSSTTKTNVAPTFSFMAEPSGNNTAAPTGTLNLLFGNGATPAATGLSISSKGVINFAVGQTFPGTGKGTITGVTTTSPLSGSGTTGSVALSLNVTALETTLNAKYAQLGGVDKFTAPVSFAVPVTFAATQTFPGMPGGGTITGVTTTAPLTGSGTKGVVALGINLTSLETTLSTKYAQLGAANRFTAPITFATGQTFPGAGTITGVTAGTGLTGGGTTGVIKLALDPSVIPTLTSSPVFSSSGNAVVGDTAGNVLNTAGVVGVAGTRTGAGGIAAVWGDSATHVAVFGSSSQYAGVYGLSTSGAGTRGDSTSNDGVNGTTVGGTLNTAGVHGIAGAGTGYGGIAGVWGDAAAHVGVIGSSSQYAGVQGFSTSGPGVQGVSTSSYGGVFSNANAYATVYATNTGSTPGSAINGTSSGADSSGVYGQSLGAGGVGMYGISSGGADSNGRQPTGVYGYSTGFGMQGQTPGGNDGTAGVLGIAAGRSGADGIAGVWGDAVNHVGVFGSSSGQTGVSGFSTTSNGVHGLSGQSAEIFSIAGVSGDCYSCLGVFGVSNQAAGVDGVSVNNIGVQGASVNGRAAVFQNNSTVYSTLYAYNASAGEATDGNLFNTFEAASPMGTCGFSGKGDLTCTGQVKSLATTGSGAHTVETYSMQSPENWMEDFGSGTLQHGAATIEIEASFAETVSESADYHVFLTPNGDSKGLYVFRKTATSFEVRESGGGVSTLSFDYRIVAKRRGLEAQRMTDVTEKFKAARARIDVQAAATAAVLAVKH